MARPEQDAGGEPPLPDHHAALEQEPVPYQRASRFAGERPAGEAYFTAQQVLYEAPHAPDLSVYRLQLNAIWHVAALGLLPPQPVLSAIEAIFDRGEPADLPGDVWQALQERRTQASRQAPWVERHHRPGERI